jgi:single-strand DNA-binding protein
MAFNKVIIMGNLTRDPELRVTPSGLSICKFTVAMNRKFKGSDGQEKEEVTYVDVDSFGKQAEVVSKYFGKGKPILVDGRLKQEKWEDKATGDKRSKLIVVMESFSFAGGEHSAEGGNAQNGHEGGEQHSGDRSSRAPRSQPVGAGARNPSPAADEIDENVPF